MHVFDLHGQTGMLAIVLMLLHAAWASLVLPRKDERLIRNFNTVLMLHCREKK